MSKRLPFMYRNVADHLAATNHLTLEELGALDRLLDNYWFRGEPLENSPETLCKLLGIRPQTYRRLFPKIANFFIVSGNRLIHPELEELIVETLDRSGKLSEAGKRGAQKRWGHDDGQVNGQVMDQARGQANGNRIEEKRIEKSLSMEIEISSKEIPPKDSDASQLADHLRARILENNPSARPNSDAWAADATAMIEEGWEPDDIAFVIDWAQRDNFWKSLTMSIAKIRKHFDQLALKSGLAENREAKAREAQRKEVEAERRIEDEVDRTWYEANKEEIDAAKEAAFQKFSEKGRKIFGRTPPPFGSKEKQKDTP